MDLVALVHEFISGNPALAGVLGATFTGSLLFLLKEVPMRLWSGFVRAFTIHLVVNSNDEVFDWINEWLSRHRYASRTHLLKLATSRSGEEEWSLAPGYGTHVIWDKGLVIVTRTFQEKAGANVWGKAQETFRIITLGTKQSAIRKLVDQAFRAKQEMSTLGVRTWMDGYWTNIAAKSKRSMDSVYLPDKQKKDIITQAEWFFANKEWFTQRGVPYRQGMLFQGPPGTGKTSIATALACHLGRPLYTINLASIRDDNALTMAFLSMMRNSVVLIEDIDATNVAAKRPEAKAQKPVKKGKKLEPATILDGEKDTGVTLSGLLNVIDGVISSEGRLLIMTTNHPQKLDPALIRKGRVDHVYTIDLATSEQVTDMARRFFPDKPAMVTEFSKKAVKSPSRALVEWQVEMMTRSQ